MKHIKIYEDYSDEELRGLQDDLEGIGHEYKLLQKGKDFGYHTTLKETLNQGYPLYFTKSAIKKLVDKGVITKENPDSNEYHFTDFKKIWLIPFGTNLYRIALYLHNRKLEYFKIENYLSNLKLWNT